MLKRLIVALVGLVGVVIVALGVASATLWRADDVLVAGLEADEHLVVTDPGVLELAAQEVTVRVEGDGPVVLAVGRDTDVDGWVGTDAHERVTGLAGWHELSSEVVPAPPEDGAGPDAGEASPTAPADGETAPGDEASPTAPAEGGTEPQGDAAEEDAAPSTVPDPTGSDLWVAEVTGDGSAELTWSAQPGRWSVLAAATGDEPPTVSLAWPREVTTPWLWPGVVGGSLLVLLAAGLLVRDLRRARRGGSTEWTPVLTGPLPVVDADGNPVRLTRRQLREMGRLPGEAPVVTGAQPAVATDETGTAGAHGSPVSAPTAAVQHVPDPAQEDGDRSPRWTPAVVNRPSPAEQGAPTPGRPSDARAGVPSAAAAASAPRSRRALRSGAPEAEHPAVGDTGRPAVPDASADRQQRASSAPEGAAPMTPQGRPAWLARPQAPRPDALAAAGRAVPPTPGAPSAGPDGLPPRDVTWARDDARRRTVPSPGAAGGPASTTTGPAPVAPAPGGGAVDGAPRPAWLRDTPTPPAPRAGAAGEPGASRADAWRRAWGLPPLPDDDATSTEEGR